MRLAARFTLLLVLGLTASAWAAGEPPLSRGEYVYRAAGCENCHTDRDHHGPVLAGGRRFGTPLGTFVTPNITPDRETGIGRWSERDFIRALREGVSPAGANYYPAFPYPSYTHLSDDDLRALYGYLMQRPAVKRANEPHELPWYLRSRPLVTFWKWIYFRPGTFRAQPGKSQSWNRGAYLVGAAGHCSECHTPREPWGGPALTRYLAGAADGPDGGTVPNITPDEATGIGRWSRTDLAQYLKTGMNPDGDFAGGLMAECIDNGFKYLTDEDRAAIAEYIFSLRPIANHIGKPEKKKQRGEFE